MESEAWLLRRVDLRGGSADVRLENGRIAAIGARLAARRGDRELDARGGALLPGLHDHHVHLLALAARLRSLDCGPESVASEAELRAALRAAGSRASGWVRGFAYHESVAGPLDRWKLDAWLPDRPVRIQHRTGALWIVSSRGLAELGPLAADEPGVERDAHGTPTGRLFRADALLRERLQSEQPDLAAVGARLAALGVTGVCDASAHNAASEAALFARAAASGALPQRLLLMGSEALPAGPHGGRAEHGALKILLDDIQLPELDGLAARVRTGHVAGRSVAFHCVTRAQLFLALAALEEAGARPGDRVEHASVAPPEALPRLAALGATVVTQPGFVHERGDLYLREVSEADRPWLYRLRGFDAAGVKLAAGTDAPYGSPDPWLAMRCAVERRTRGGAPLGEEEAVAPERALALFTTPLEAPGGSPRDVAVGAPADLCLLHVPWREARKQLSSALVAATWIAGALAWRSSADRG